MLNFIVTRLSIFILIVCAGCSHSLNPSPQQINNDKVIQFSVPGKITIRNAQQDDQKILIGVLAGHKYYGSLKKWTDEAVGLMEDELKLRGAEISSTAPKTLDLAITEAILDAEGGAWRKRCMVTIQLETGGGFVNTYKGVVHSGGFEARAAGGGVTMALTEILKDETIIKYLNE